MLEELAASPALTSGKDRTFRYCFICIVDQCYYFRVLVETDPDPSEISHAVNDILNAGYPVSIRPVSSYVIDPLVKVFLTTRIP